jgi:hypothetical protein
MSNTDTANLTSRRGRLSRHISFLAYEGFEFLLIAIAASVVAIVLYIWWPPNYGDRYGGGWTGYTLGTVGALLILWLTWFGYKKRAYDARSKYIPAHDHHASAPVAAEVHLPEDPARLARRLSAHVYLGLALIIIATLHTGFHFGWNIHTLAYTLMMIVIVSGAYGIIAYRQYPRLMTLNRDNLTLADMRRQVVAIDSELRGIQIDEPLAGIIRGSLDNTPVGGSVWCQVTGHYPSCGTARAIDRLQAGTANIAAPANVLSVLREKLGEKSVLIERMRRDVRYKALMDIWLYLHVPLTFALLAALIAHVISVFYFF